MNTQNTANIDLSAIEKIINYTFTNKHLLLQAFVRSSFAKEHPEWESNEVLEFIGDSILGAFTAKKLALHFGQFYKGFFSSELNESALSDEKIHIVQGKTLAAATERVGLEKHLIMSEGDRKQNVQEESSVKEDLFEALIGAITLDCNWNMQTVGAVIERLLNPEALLAEDGEECEARLNDWHRKAWGKGTEIFSRIEKEHPLPYFCSITLAIPTADRHHTAFASSEQTAKRIAVKQAWKAALAFEKRKTAALEAITNPNPARAVNQLQELWQKGIISEPRYEFSENGSLSENGNPRWECACIIEGLIENHGFIADSKQEAKRFAAMETLLNILGTVIPWDEASILETKRIPVSL